MLAYVDIILPALLFNVILISPICGRPKLKFLENCDPVVNYDTKLNLTLKTVGNQQYLDGSFILKEDIDNNIRSNVSVHMFIANEYVYIFSINERKTCDALHKYLGEFFYDMERNAQLIPKMCPIPKGTHRLHNAPIDLEKIPTLRSFPLGTLRFTDVLYNSKNKINSCFVWVMESHV